MAYDPAIADEIASRIATGETLRAICREDRMPCWRTVYDWINGNPEFAARIAQARETGYDAIAEEAMAIADESPPSTQFGTTDGGAVSTWQTPLCFPF